MDIIVTPVGSIDVIDLARENFVTIISLPPHSTHKMQPLDKAFMGPLKIYYNEQIRLHLRNTGRKMTHDDFAELFHNAYLKVQTAAVAINGFRMTGISPINKDIFTESDFIAAQILDSALFEPSSNYQVPVVTPHVPNVLNTSNQGGQSSPLEDQPSPRAGPSGYVTPWEISPIPKINKKRQTRGPKSTVATIITRSPYKNALQVSIAKKSKVDKPAVVVRKTRVSKLPAKGKVTKKVKTVPVYESDCSTTTVESYHPDESDSGDDISVFGESQVCCICKGVVTDNMDATLSCLQCELLVHEKCVEYNERELFVCSSCNDIFSDIK